MKKILFVLFILYSIHFVYYNYINPPDEQTYMTNKAMFDFSTMQYEKRKLTICSYGKRRGEIFEKFDQFALGFSTKDELTIDSGRKLLLNIANEFIESINENKILEKYLAPYPFNFSNVEISVYVSDPIHGQKLFPEGFTKEKKISFLFLTEGNIYYYIDTDKNLPMQKIFQENYEDALKILKENNEI